MQGRKERNEVLAKNVANRIKKIIGNTPLTEVAKKLNGRISQKTLWAYINALSIPGPDILILLADKYETTVDWILKGEESLVPKNEKEIRFLEYYREAEKLGIENEIERDIKVKIAIVKQESTETKSNMPSKAA